MEKKPVPTRARTSARRKPVTAPSPPSEPAQTYDFAVSIGQVARRIREELGLTLANVAQEARISPGMLSRLETGQVSPSLETIVALSRALGVRPALLLQEVGESGDTRGTHLMGRVFGGYWFNASAAWIHGPFARLTYQQAKVDAWSEA